MPEEEGNNPLKGLEAEFKKQPKWVWIAAAGAAGIVGFVILKNRAAAASKAAATQTTAGQAPTNGLDVASLAGIPYGSIDGGYNSNGGGPVDNYPPVPPIPTPPPTPAPPPTQQGGMIRSRFDKPADQGYDQGHPQGVPIHSGAGGNTPIVSYAQFSSQIAFTGPPITGSTNLGNPSQPGGSLLWFPVQGGFISAYDIVSYLTLPTPTFNPAGVTTTGTTGIGGGGRASGWQSILNLGRSTIDQHAVSFDLLN